MASFKVAVVIFCVLLAGEKSLGVLNKSSSKIINDEENKISQGLEDRISNEYGAPPRPHFDGPAPVYGPPELTGNHGQQPIYPPPPADIPPPVVPLRPEPVYGAPPRNPPQFPPRPIKIAPWKLPGRYPTKPAGHGPPIPISPDSYGPPNFSIQRPQNQYGPPQPFPVLPPIPQSPPPGVPAPPTPPEIKYDGWQPIAGHVETPQIYQQPEQHNVNVNANANTNANVNANVNVEVNVPSNSYGEPIRNQEDHNLRQAVGPSDTDSGLPPPALPEQEPFHNIQEPAKDIDTLPKTSKPPAFSSSFENEINSHDDLSFTQQQLPASPGVSDSYGPPAPVYPGPYPTAPGPSSFGGSSFNQQTFKQHRQQHSFINFPHQRNPPPSFRPHSPPHGAFSPPRNRAPSKFREITSSLLNSIHRYRPFGQAPSHPPSGNFGRPSFGFQQQPPVINNAVPFHSGPSSFGNSALAAPNVNYGTPLSFSNFNTPAPPGLTYGAPNFGQSASFGSAFSSISGGNGNLYQQNSNGGLPTSYGTPYPVPQVQFNPGQGDCSHKNTAFNSLNLEQSQLRQAPANAEPVPTIDTDFQLPLINQLELEPFSSLPHIDIKDSYGNPAGATSDQRTAQSAPTGHSAEAFTAALTAQGYSQQSSDNLASTNELNIDQLNQLQSEPALALAQTLSAEGASDGFQIQGSKGIYTLQIQPANEPHANENSDGTIRHDKLLSNGLLQDILAAIEQPGQGGPAQLISIQGSPQSQSLRDAAEHNDFEHQQDLAQSASSSAVTSEVKTNENAQIMNSENVALFFNNNNNNNDNNTNNNNNDNDTQEESNKETRSTSKNEGNAGEVTTTENPSESETPSPVTSQP